MELAQASAVGLMGTALVLGVRHGIDWDHIAAITDITSTAAADAPQTRRATLVNTHALALASLYALGHALVVALLGLAALYFAAVLPEWVDPLMERVVGFTLLALGVWVFYSLWRFWRGEGDFQFKSRWMLVFAGVRHAWHSLQHRVGGQRHDAEFHVDQYGPRTAFGVGLIHGIGAETGTQVLIIAAVGGAASQGLGPAMMMAFIVGLLISNTTIAFLSATGFISSSRARPLYVAIGALAGVFSLFVGAYFLFGLSGQLPDLPSLFGFLGGGAAD